MWHVFCGTRAECKCSNDAQHMQSRHRKFHDLKCRRSGVGVALIDFGRGWVGARLDGHLLHPVLTV